MKRIQKGIWIFVFWVFHLDGGFAQTHLFRESFAIGYMAGVPFSPSQFESYWKTGNGMSVSYGWAFSRRWAWVVEGGYLDFGLDGTNLRKELNPYFGTTGPFSFSHGAWKMGLFRTGFRWIVSVPESPIRFFFQGMAGVYLSHQEKMLVSRKFSQETLKQRIALGGDEAIGGGSLGIGTDISVFEQLFWWICVEGHGVFTQDQVDASDLMVARFSRAQGKPSIVGMVRTGIQWIW